MYNYMKWRLIGLLLCMILLSIYIYRTYFHTKYPTYTANQEQQRINQTNTNGKTLLFFYATWCPYCKPVIPIINDVATNNKQVTVKMVDCSETNPLMQTYNVNQFPTLLLVKGDQIVEFNTSPTREHIVQFLSI